MLHVLRIQPDGGEEERACSERLQLYIGRGREKWAHPAHPRHKLQQVIMTLGVSVKSSSSLTVSDRRAWVSGPCFCMWLPLCCADVSRAVSCAVCISPHLRRS